MGSSHSVQITFGQSSKVPPHTLSNPRYKDLELQVLMKIGSSLQGQWGFLWKSKNDPSKSVFIDSDETLKQAFDAAIKDEKLEGDAAKNYTLNVTWTFCDEPHRLNVRTLDADAEAAA